MEPANYGRCFNFQKERKERQSIVKWLPQTSIPNKLISGVVVTGLENYVYVHPKHESVLFFPYN
jgi:hypothetical protein